MILEQNLDEKPGPKMAIVADTDHAVLKKASIVDLSKFEDAVTDRIIPGAPAPGHSSVNSSKYAQGFFAENLGWGSVASAPAAPLPHVAVQVLQDRQCCNRGGFSPEFTGAQADDGKVVLSGPVYLRFREATLRSD